MSEVAVVAESARQVVIGRPRQTPVPGREFFCRPITQHVKSLASDLLTLGATLLAIGLWGLCLFLVGA